MRALCFVVGERVKRAEKRREGGGRRRNATMTDDAGMACACCFPNYAVNVLIDTRDLQAIAGPGRQQPAPIPC